MLFGWITKIERIPFSRLYSLLVNLPNAARPAGSCRRFWCFFRTFCWLVSAFSAGWCFWWSPFRRRPCWISFRHWPAIIGCGSGINGWNFVVMQFAVNVFAILACIADFVEQLTVWTMISAPMTAHAFEVIAAILWISEIWPSVLLARIAIDKIPDITQLFLLAEQIFIRAFVFGYNGFVCAYIVVAAWFRTPNERSIGHGGTS